MRSARDEDDEREIARATEFAEAWLTEAALAVVLGRPRGAWSTLRAVTPGVPDPADDLALVDVYVTWTEDPAAGHRFLDLPRALVVFHCEGLDWTHSVLVDIRG